MAKKQIAVPGTVSKILWHFTGGPIWDSRRSRQGKGSKSTEAAYEAIVGILKSGELRIGSYKEVVNVIIPEVKTWDADGKHRSLRKDVECQLVSAPVCCLADIPIQHLSYHADRYGKSAIGFHREAVVRHGFSPVFYQLRDSGILLSIYNAMAALKELGTRVPEILRSDIEEGIKNAKCLEGHPMSEDAVRDILGDLNFYHDAQRVPAWDAKQHFERLLAFVKTFDQKDFATIYCEREWRSTATWSFRPVDLAMIVLPREGNHFSTFINEEISNLDLPKTLPVVPWEDLVEH